MITKIWLSISIILSLNFYLSIAIDINYIYGHPHSYLTYGLPPSFYDKLLREAQEQQHPERPYQNLGKFYDNYNNRKHPDPISSYYKKTYPNDNKYNRPQYHEKEIKVDVKYTFDNYDKNNYNKDSGYQKNYYVEKSKSVYREPKVYNIRPYSYEKPKYTSEYTTPYPYEESNKYQEYQSSNQYDQKSRFQEYTSPSPFHVPLSYFKQITKPYYPPTINSPIYSNHSVRVHQIPSEIQRERVPTVVLNSGSVPLNLNIRTKSSKVHVHHSHDSLPPETFSDYSRDGQIVLNREIVKPVLHNVHEVIVPERKIVQEIRPVREEIRTVVASNQNQNYPQPEECEHDREQEYEKTREHDRTREYERTREHDRIREYDRSPEHERTRDHERRPEHDRVPEYESVREQDRRPEHDGIPEYDKTREHERVPEHGYGGEPSKISHQQPYRDISYHRIQEYNEPSTEGPISPDDPHKYPTDGTYMYFYQNQPSNDKTVTKIAEK